MHGSDAWPALAPWEPTKRSLHLYAQMLGKLRLALSPHQPNFLFTGLALTPRGFTTGTMPYGARAMQASVDVFDAMMIVESSDGRERRIPLDAPCTVARVFADLHEALAVLEFWVTISPIPQEVPDTTPLDADDRPAPFDRAAAQRWLAIVTAANNVFDRWRAHFFGRVGIQLWWGAFDYSIMLFNGNKVDPPADRGYLLHYDLDAELMNVGLYFGDEPGAAVFYGYIYPQPAGCEMLAVAPDGAMWSDTLREWVLPYETVRASADPERTLVAFLDALYRLAGDAAGWNRAGLSYTPPPLRRAPSTN
jgi:hypothetical protein